MIEVIATEIDGGYRLTYPNGNVIGDALTMDDGYLGLWLNASCGCETPGSLRAIADKMVELDKPWDDVVKAHFDGEAE